MGLVRTTLRLEERLKKTAEKRAVEEDTTLQEIFNRALAAYLEKEGKRRAHSLLFKTHDLGRPLDHLKRADYYRKP